MKAPRPCPICDRSDYLRVDCVCPPIPVRDMDFVAYCENCYDGAPDAGPQLTGSGATEERAIADWHESADDWTAPGGWVCQSCGRGVVENHECPQCGEKS